MIGIHMRTLVIVYQAGIANVFEDRRRLLQSDFRTCEMFCRGAQAMGATIVPAWANVAGDVSRATWNYEDFDNAPFNDKFGICYRMEGAKAA
jgi:hypothetical protein